MVKRIKVKSVEEFEEMLQEQDLKISKAIIEVALKNLKGDKRFIPVLEIHVEEDDYEGCARIAKAIQELEK